MDPRDAISREERRWSWHVFQRWQQYDAEVRVNLLRILAIGFFYLIHLANHYLPLAEKLLHTTLQLRADTRLDNLRHNAVTALAFAWLMGALMVHSMLRSQRFPGWLPAASIVFDSILLTAMLLLSSGAASPLVSGYFLIIVMSGMRYDLHLVRGATLSALVGYLFVLGATRWPFGLIRQQPLPPVPRYHQLMILGALALCAVTIGQMIRQMQKWFLDERREESGRVAR